MYIPLLGDAPSDVPEPKLAFHFYGGFETSHFDTNWVFKLSLPSPKDDHGESGTL
jgi:hypothetical protein